MILKGRYKFITYKLQEHSNAVEQTGWYHNIIVLNYDGDISRGMNTFIRNLGNDLTVTLPIVKAKLGIGSPVLDIATTDLTDATVDDILIANTTFIDDNTIEFKFFASDLQVPDDDYTEIGLFMGDDRLFSLSAIDPVFEKATGVDTTIIYQIMAVTES
jgi:hypothetical protein